MTKEKRDSLEQFIHAQMEGPGACNGKFDYVDETGNTCNNIVDVINTTPGSLYSTAILFPLRKQNFENKQPDSNDINSNDKLSEVIEDPEDDDITDCDEEGNLKIPSDEDDLYSLNQRFPNAIGISCCLDGHNLIDNNDIKISISGRYYTKIKKDKFQFLIILIDPKDRSDFNQFYSRYINEFSQYFKLGDRGLSTKNSISTKNYVAVKQQMRSINLMECRIIATNPDNSLDPDFESIGENYRYLKSYKEKLWNRLKKINDGNYLTDKEKDSIISRIKKIEKCETLLSYIDDVIQIHNPLGYGYWIGKKFEKIIDLSGIDFNSSNNKAIYSWCKYKSLKDVILFESGDGDKNDVKAALSLRLQVTKDSRYHSSNRYLRVQVENTSTVFEETLNRYFSIVNENVNGRSFFGIKIRVESNLLIEYNHESRIQRADNEVKNLDYIYRNIKDYGIGHFCSVKWNISRKMKSISTEFLPAYSIPDIEFVPRDKYCDESEYVVEEGHCLPKRLLLSTKVLEFKWLSTFSGTTNEEIANGLSYFVDTYCRWIESIEGKTDNNEIAIQNIQRCKSDCNRMRSNIELILRNNEINLKTFRLMNSAMFIQLWHGKNHDRLDQIPNNTFYANLSDHIFGDEPARWRPFQLAFILLNLDGIFQRVDDPQWNMRNDLVDLVWFPTGGGKTEAYLGIIALAVLNRRRTLNSRRNGGTVAIMRYTLRLLATQQFQRALLIILALEQLRLFDVNDLGDEPISIGLFVGQDSLPNKAKDLLVECEKWNTIGEDGIRKESKIPLDRCPWCGEKLVFLNSGTTANPKISFRCLNHKCTFSNSKAILPVKLCDEDVYKTPPTLLFGTVDKFASLGHKVSNDVNKTNEDSRRIFGKGRNINNIPPELIIQDELHLLLGPLGSAVALFECAIDQLCTYKNANGIEVRPKIISSTATTRNTDIQIRALYDRDVNIFPKNGIDYDDSFFAFYKRERISGNIQFVSKRKYIGIMPTGRTQMTAQLRLVAIMFVHRALFEKNHPNVSKEEFAKSMDYYHSTISYFNSLKEVGKTDAQFYTEFTKYTRRLLKRVLRYSDMLECFYGYDSSFNEAELTGRLKGSEVVRELSKVSQKWDKNRRLPYYENGKWHKGFNPPDLILATNMISVGLDISRFNCIIINSMPRNIAEYIQASSRVARDDNGIVVTLYNPFRMRDISHFEKFIEFHEKLYYFVEPISITPFSKKSIEKYFPLFLATMIRHNDEDLCDDNSACRFTHEKSISWKRKIMKYFDERLNHSLTLNVSERDLLTLDLRNNISDFIDKAFAYWETLINKQNVGNFKLRYSNSYFLNHNSRNGNKYEDLFLSLDDYEESDRKNIWRVPMSLREIESEAAIKVIEKDGNF